MKTTVTWPSPLSAPPPPACSMLVSVAAALLLLASSLQEAEAKPQNNYNQYYSEYNNQDYSENYAGNYDQQVNVKKVKSKWTESNRMFDTDFSADLSTSSL